MTCISQDVCVCVCVPCSFLGLVCMVCMTLGFHQLGSLIKTWVCHRRNHSWVLQDCLLVSGSLLSDCLGRAPLHGFVCCPARTELVWHTRPCMPPVGSTAQ